jgi:hypothetical protein
MRTDCRHNLVSKVVWCLSKKEWRRLSVIGVKVEINIFHICQQLHPSFASLSVSYYYTCRVGPSSVWSTYLHMKNVYQ